MLQRCISLLLIAGLVVGQLAAVPHSHAGLSPEEQQLHDATPHFHLAEYLVTSDHSRGHSHNEQTHSNGDLVHSHAAKQQDAIARRPDARPACPPPSEGIPAEERLGIEHDASAVFVPQLAVSSWATNQKDCDSPVSPAELYTVVEDPTDSWTSFASTPPWHPPDAVLDASDTYLTLRNLRI